LANRVKIRLLREPLVFFDFAYATQVLRHPGLFIPVVGTWRVVGVCVAAIAIPRRRRCARAVRSRSPGRRRIDRGAGQHRVWRDPDPTEIRWPDALIPRQSPPCRPCPGQKPGLEALSLPRRRTGPMRNFPPSQAAGRLGQPRNALSGRRPGSTITSTEATPVLINS
jgi:hypothetical protein